MDHRSLRHGHHWQLPSDPRCSRWNESHPNGEHLHGPMADQSSDGHFADLRPMLACAILRRAHVPWTTPPIGRSWSAKNQMTKGEA